MFLLPPPHSRTPLPRSKLFSWFDNSRGNLLVLRIGLRQTALNHVHVTSMNVVLESGMVRFFPSNYIVQVWCCSLADELSFRRSCCLQPLWWWKRRDPLMKRRYSCTQNTWCPIHKTYREVTDTSIETHSVYMYDRACLCMRNTEGGGGDGQN